MVEAAAPSAPLILVVDDDARIREVICDMLADAGLRTVTATDGNEVLNLSVNHRPALIIMDVMMPNMDGYTTLARLRSHPVTKGIPVVILSAHSTPVYHTLSAGTGAEAHLTKPFSPEDLTRAVQRILGSRPG